MDRRIGGAPRRAGDCASGRPSAAGRPRSRAGRWHEDTRALRRGARNALRPRTGRARRQPAHVPRRQRPRVRSRLPPSARREGASRPSAKRPAALADERRLLYVGITRAKRYLYLTWSADAKPSRFLAELGVSAAPRARRSQIEPAEREQPAFRALREWRRERALADGSRHMSSSMTRHSPRSCGGRRERKTSSRRFRASAPRSSTGTGRTSWLRSPRSLRRV